MPAYMITIKANQGGDILVDDPALALKLTDTWATFVDEAGICLAIPREHVGNIQRVDPQPQDTATEG